jgi:hypothetical protein
MWQLLYGCVRGFAEEVKIERRAIEHRLDLQEYVSFVQAIEARLASFDGGSASDRQFVRQPLLGGGRAPHLEDGQCFFVRCVSGIGQAYDRAELQSSRAFEYDPVTPMPRAGVGCDRQRVGLRAEPNP